MLLRRITIHVKEQNWFAVGIDFVIVVIGVFIGIQVANWNDARSENARADDLISQLISEAVVTRSELEQYRIVHQELGEQAVQLVLSLRNRDSCLAMNDELKIGIASLADFPPPRFSLSNAQQALNTGNLALIRSSDIRTSIQSVSEEMNFVDRQWERYVNIKQYASDVAQRSSGLALTGRGVLELTPLSGYNPDDYEVLTPELVCENADVVALVSNTAITQQIYTSYLEQVEAALDSYLDTLNEKESAAEVQ